MADGADAGHRQCCFLMTGRVVCEAGLGVCGVDGSGMASLSAVQTTAFR